MNLVNELPYQSRDTYLYRITFCDKQSLFALSSTCRLYRKWAQEAPFWKDRCQHEGIPLVHSTDPEKPLTSFMTDYFVLQPMVICGEKVKQLFGEVVGKIPSIPDNWFNAIVKNEQDPLDPEGTYRKNYLIVVDSPFRKKGELKMPWSLRNIEIHSREEDKDPLFQIQQEVQEKLDDFPSKTRAYLVRMDAPLTLCGGSSAIISYGEQLESLQQKNPHFQGTTFRVRAFMNAFWVHILKKPLDSFIFHNKIEWPCHNSQNLCLLPRSGPFHKQSHQYKGGPLLFYIH